MKKDISRIILKALRHKPESLGLTLDLAGYCCVEELVRALKEKGYQVTKEDIDKVGENERFSFDQYHTKIRADYGNSIGLLLSNMYPQDDKPPNILYHGTSFDAISNIQEKGIIRFAYEGLRARDHIFMTELPSVALKKGSRHGKGVGLPVYAVKMYENGYQFYHAKNDIWLTDYIPPEYIDFSAMVF